MLVVNSDLPIGAHALDVCEVLGTSNRTNCQCVIQVFHSFQRGVLELKISVSSVPNRIVAALCEVNIHRTMLPLEYFDA